MVKLLISLILLFNLINFSNSTKDVIVDKINNLDEVLLEVKDPATREIVKMIIDTMKFIEFPLEFGDKEKYVKNKPFVEERISQNLKMIGLLSSQINDQLLPFITQNFANSQDTSSDLFFDFIPLGKSKKFLENYLFGKKIKV
uniref:Fatty-acid and retinol-binding protein 1 n=1 Tax=Strongyloides papillosus TaxID=174720 RepID=A0A0N5BR81_STREA